MQRSFVNIKLQDSGGFKEGDRISIIDAKGDVVDHGVLSLIRECPESYSHRILSIDGRYHRISFRFYEENPDLYAVKTDDLDEGSLHIMRSKLGICDALLCFVHHAEISPDRMAKIKGLTDSLHQEIIDAMVKEAGGLKSIHKTSCDMHGHYEITSDDIERNVNLSIAESSRQIMLKRRL